MAKNRRFDYRRLSDDYATMNHKEIPALVSVIMPCYNSAAFVREAIRCVMHQSYPAVEVIAVDDGSTDETMHILELLRADHPTRITIVTQSHRGPYPARNLGLTRARGTFVAFLDADDYWTSDCLERLHVALINAHADLAYCGWQNVGTGAPGVEPFIPPDYLEGDTAETFLKGCPWPIHAALVRRTVIDAIGGFSERRFSAMDYDLWLRVYAFTRKITRVPAVLAFYRWHDHGQISKAKWRQVLDAVDARKLFVEQNPGLVSHLEKMRLRELTTGVLIREAHRAFWNRHLRDAHVLFRRAFPTGAWSITDLKYLAIALLPYALFELIVKRSDRSAPNDSGNSTLK